MLSRRTTMISVQQKWTPLTTWIFGKTRSIRTAEDASSWKAEKMSWKYSRLIKQQSTLPIFIKTDAKSKHTKRVSSQNPPSLQRRGIKHYSIFFILSIASAVLSWSEKAVKRKKPSPLLPKPAPGVPTTAAFSNRKSKNSQESIPFGHFIQI